VLKNENFDDMRSNYFQPYRKIFYYIH